MQLKKFNKLKDIQILMKYKLLENFRIKIINILLIILIFIIEFYNLIKLIYYNKNVQLLKWKQEINHQNNYYNKELNKINIFIIIILFNNYINYQKD